jgi:hypothetical protein
MSEATFVTEIALLKALAARMTRIDGQNDYFVDIENRVPEQRIDFASLTDDMPLVGVVLHGGEHKDVGDAAHFFDQETQVELVGCIAAGDDNTDPLKLLGDMKRAVFESNTMVLAYALAGGEIEAVLLDVGDEAGSALALTGEPVPDIVQQSVTITPDGWHVFLASEGEAFTQVSLYLIARWCDSSVEH